MASLFFNDSYIDNSALHLHADNRSFKYGDGLFETIFISNKKAAFLDLHLQRLKEGMELLQINIPEQWQIDFFQEKITALCVLNNFQHARCRLTVWRGGEGHYTPVSNDAQLLIELFRRPSGDYLLNAEGLHLGEYKGLPKPRHALSAHKTANALIYVLAAKYAHEQNVDDVVVLNDAGGIADCISSNIFLYRQNKLITPASNEGGVHGIMKKVVMYVCRMEGIEILEQQLKPDELENGNEIFLTNAIHGVQWIKKYRQRTYYNNFSKDLTYIINEAKDNATLVSP